MALPVVQPSRVTVMIKPVGALCNLECKYCYYLPVKGLFEAGLRRMSLETLRDVFAGVLPAFADEVTVAWQGGEPTLAGLDFFKEAFELQKRYLRKGQRVNHALQTNGTLLNDEWCQFLKEKEFLVGLSLDGPGRFHDRYRVHAGGRRSAEDVLRAMRLMQKHGVQYNILCVLNDLNVNYPDEVFGYLVNQGSLWLQFVPAVEWEAEAGDASRRVLAGYSPDPEAYGRFLCRVFDVWFERYRDRISVRDFDAVLNKLVLGQTPLCILDGSCHTQMTIEHDGSVFGCDHFVERRWQLGKIGLEAGGEDAGWLERMDGGRLGEFAARKGNVAESCKACNWRHLCHGGCPKHRSGGGDVAERTVLCPGYKAFFGHAMERLEWLAGYLRRGEQPPGPDPRGGKMRNKKRQNDVDEAGDGVYGGRKQTLANVSGRHA